MVSTLGLRGAAALIAILLAGCGSPAEHRRATGGSPRAVDPATGAVMPIAQAPKLAAPCSRQSPARVTGYFLPSTDEIARLEAGLAGAMAPLLTRARRRGGSFPYHRQYAGLVRPDGRRSIYVSAFPSGVERSGQSRGADTVQWREVALLMCDGGTGFWGIEYDVQTGAFSGFEHNGIG